MFLGMMAVPFAAYGAGQVAPLIGSGLSSGLSALNTWHAAHPVLSTAIDAAFAGHGLNDVIQNGLNVENALEMIPLAGLTYKGAKTGYNTAKAAIQSRSLGKPSEAAVSELFPVGNPQIRTKLGDVEIDNPQLAYRQGNDIGRTYIKYRNIDNSMAQHQIEDNISQAVQKSGYQRQEPLLDEVIIGGTYDPIEGVKGPYGSFAFQDVPMYSKGFLWYGAPRIDQTLKEGDLTSGLLTTMADDRFLVGSSKATPYKRNGKGIIRNGEATSVTDNGGRLVPSDTDNFGYNLDDIEAYTFIPGFGYRKVQSHNIPSLTWGKANTIFQYSNTGSPYEKMMGKGVKVDRGSWMESNLGVDGKRFGKYIGSGGEQTVFEDATNPNSVLKVYNDTYIKDVDGLKEFNRTFPARRNTIPLQDQIKFKGYVKDGDNLYPVYSQRRLNPLNKMSIAEFNRDYLPLLQRLLSSRGYTGDGISSEFTNGIKTLIDIKPDNMGLTTDGQLRFLDVDFISKKK